METLVRAGGKEPGQIVVRPRIIGARGDTIPSLSVAVIQRNAHACIIEIGKMGLRGDQALLRGLQVPGGGFVGVLVGASGVLELPRVGGLSRGKVLPGPEN